VRGALQGAPGPAREGAGDGWLKRVPLEAAPQGRPEEGAHTYAIRPFSPLPLLATTRHSALRTRSRATAPLAKGLEAVEIEARAGWRRVDVAKGRNFVSQIAS
jgi:hypothetical protein